MRLRSRAKKQQLVQGKDASSFADANTKEPPSALGLPEELMQLLLKCLSQEDVANASMACQLWARVLRAGITKATYVVGDDHQQGREAAEDIKALGKHTSVSDLQLLITSRSSWDNTAIVMHALDTLPHLRHLQLRLLVSNTPRKGSCPIFFSDNMSTNLQQLESITIEGPLLPYVALQNTLQNLQEVWCQQPAAGQPAPPRQLTLKLGQQPSGSQLPEYQPPTWLKDHTQPLNSALDTDLLNLLVGIPSLSSLRCQFIRLAPSLMAPLSKLTYLTSLTLDEPAISAPMAKQLTCLQSLRRLKLSFDVLTPASLDALQDLGHVQDLHLGVRCGSCHSYINTAAMDTALQPLLTRPPGNLRGLTLQGLSLQQSYVSQLATLTGLTSLQLVKTIAGQPFLDLTDWRRLTGLQELSLQVSKPMEFMQLKFAPPPPPPKPEKVLTGPCSSVGKRRKSSLGLLSPAKPVEDKTKWGDVSALPAAWPNLQALQISGVYAYAVGNTSWEGLSTLTNLTSLALQFGTEDKNAPRSFFSGCRGLLQFTGEWGVAPPIVRLEHLPASVQELRLANCYVGVPAEGCLRAGDSLTSISLSGCWMGSIHKGISTRQGQPLVVRNAIAVAPTDAVVVGDSHPLLLLLLQHTRQLRALELINLPWLTDAVLAAAAGQTQLQGLSSVSVVGIGNQHLTHGALLGLTGLRKLRELRWHVGDILELMPDVNALAQLKGLVLLSIPHWLHNQMERWGAYAVLDSMPLCDVNVEVPL